MRGSWRVFVAFRITRPFEFTIGEQRPRKLLKPTIQTICHHEKLKTKDAPTWERSLHGQTLSLPHRRRSVCRFVVLRTRRRLPVPQPMLLTHRSGAVRYRKEHFPPLSALPFRPSYRCRDSSETQGAAETLCDIGQEIAGNASSGLPA